MEGTGGYLDLSDLGSNTLPLTVLHNRMKYVFLPYFVWTIFQQLNLLNAYELKTVDKLAKKERKGFVSTHDLWPILCPRKVE